MKYESETAQQEALRSAQDRMESGLRRAREAFEDFNSAVVETWVGLTALLIHANVATREQMSPLVMPFMRFSAPPKSRPPMKAPVDDHRHYSYELADLMALAPDKPLMWWIKVAIPQLVESGVLAPCNSRWIGWSARVEEAIAEIAKRE